MKRRRKRTTSKICGFNKTRSGKCHRTQGERGEKEE